MKKYLILALIVLGALPAHAQIFSGEDVINNPNFDKQRFSYGYFLGFNTYDFDFDYKNYIEGAALGKDYSVDRTIGFNVGLIGNMRLSDHLDLRLEPGVSFNRINFQLTKADAGTFREVNSTFVHIPLLLKFSTTRINNFKPFVVGGVSTSINLSSNENNPEDNEDGQFRMTTNNFYYEIGLGIDLYLYYFKFTPSIRGVFAINDELVRDDNPNSIYTRNVEKMSSRAIFINFTFQ
ncbi:type IX secretion/gliding motility protein PorT/SprT [Salinimicrobium sediminilitoris]|uniref:type IX secretion/gliding motility protein PorT/SprT n=1 Tax=Salinimicrobium sediminilitoris TaxID=2876715 RepID=UPI001E526A19|nr:porin family protein [Salinimicrobium sediminilitoris]MCC8358275.1 PorT family protein [Salinimicrobium sediminilitoris]